MSMSRAVTLCPDLVIVPPHFAAYRAASTQVIDEAFLDVSNLDAPGDVLARQLHATIADELGRPCSLDVASKKLVAKIATDMGKQQARTAGTGYPNALCVVPPGEEAAFLAPLPAVALWGVGPKTAERLATLGIYTIGDLAAYLEDALGRLMVVRPVARIGSKPVHRAAPAHWQIGASVAPALMRQHVLVKRGGGGDHPLRHDPRAATRLPSATSAASLRVASTCRCS